MGYFVCSVLCAMRSTSNCCTNTKIWRINTWATLESRSVAQGCWSVGAAGPKRKEPNGLVRSVRRDATAKPHPASASASCVRHRRPDKTQSRARLTFGRLLVMGNAATILSSLSDSARGRKAEDGRPSRTDNVVECPPYRPIYLAYLPNTAIHPSLPYTGRVRRPGTAKEAGQAE